jgi:hypothetical protein
MSVAESEARTARDYEPFTPFEESYTFEAEPDLLTSLEQAQQLVVTPFVPEYAGVDIATPEVLEVQELLVDLFDSEFDDVLAEIAHEAWGAATQRAEQFGETRSHATAEQFLQEWVEPLRQQSMVLLDNLALAASEHDLLSMGEAEFDEFFQRFEPHGTGLEPYFEDFLGKLAKKARKVAKKGVAAAKKGVARLPGISGLLGKLKGLVQPLLDRVLRVAIDKLPPTLRPMARQLARKLLRSTVGEAEAYGGEFGEPLATPDVSTLQERFDLELAELLLANDETEQELVVTEAVQLREHDELGTITQLHEARAQFIDDLEAGVDPARALEQFIPAVMSVLPIARTAVRIIGRKRVVSFLANILAGLVGRYVPKDAARALSSAIVDAGLRMLSLETPDPKEDASLATDALMHTVEDTVLRVAAFDEATLEDGSLLEAATTEAFREAAAENFPPQTIVPELHEAPLRTTWVALPRGGQRRYYKKYTQIFDTEITPQAAASITTFGGSTLAAFLKDQLGVSAPVRARVHLYQAIAGTTLPRVARFEQGVPGLGLSSRIAAVQFHPLTVAAAATLVQQPGLGRDVAGALLSRRGRIAVGQRLYFLEIPGARPITVTVGASTRPTVRRSSQVNVTLDFPRDEFRVFVYLSEADSQDVAQKLRRHDVVAATMAVRRLYGEGLKAAMTGDLQGHVKIRSEALQQDEFLGRLLDRVTNEVKQRLARKVGEWVGKALVQYLKGQAGAFMTATEDPADGVTLAIRIVNPPGAPLVRRLLGGDTVEPDALRDLHGLFRGDPEVSVETLPGYRFD